LVNDHVETVLFDRVSKDDNLKVNKVVFDNYQVFYDVTNCLIKKGKEKIGFLSGHKGIHAFEDRIEGYKTALSDNGIPFDPAILKEGIVTTEDVSSSIDNIKQYAIDSLIITNEKTTIETILYLRNIGIDIPNEILPVGAENRLINELVNHSIPTIRYDSFEMGKATAHLLIESIDNDNNSEKYQTKIVNACIIEP